MTHDAAVLKAREIASRVLAPSAGQNDKAGRFSTEAVVSLGESGLLGLMLPVDVGGLGLGPRTFAAVIASLAEADAFGRHGLSHAHPRRRDDLGGAAKRDSGSHSRTA